MNLTFRWLLLAMAGVQVVFAVLFWAQVPGVIALWPFPGTSPLSNILIASFFAAAAASTAWAALARRERAVTGIALDYLAIFGPFAVFSLVKAIPASDPALAAFAGISAGGALLGGWMWWRVRDRPWADPQPMPRVVRASFALFVVALLLAGVALIANVPNILPWTITPDLSVVFGVMFLGAATYFAYGLRHPRWENAIGQLAGFLAYDLVLIVPFLQRMPGVPEQHRLGLGVYIVVVVYSGALAIWYLGVNPATRLWSPRPG